MKYKQDWLLIGRFIATLVKLSAIISSVFKKAEVGFEVIEWCVGSGKDFVDQKLTEIAAEYRRLNPLPQAPTSPPKPEVEKDPILHVDRSQPFDPAFIGKGWTIWKGPNNGDGLSGDEDQDARSLALTEVDLSKVRLETCLHTGESAIRGEEKHRRLRSEHSADICLDAKIFQMLWENQHLIPDSWKEKTNGNTTYIFFDGTVLRGPSGYRYVLCLYWFGGALRWDYGWLGDVFYASDPSAVLAS